MRRVSIISLVLLLFVGCSEYFTDNQSEEYNKRQAAREAENAPFRQREREDRQRMWEAERNQEEQQKATMVAVEAECARMKKEWGEFIQSCDGSLRNKTTQEVKKLVDRWKHHWTSKYVFYWPCEDAKENEVLSLENFDKVFGKPLKTQFTSGSGWLDVDKYYLWYACKDGNVQIAVNASEFDKGLVKILDLNIF